MLCLHVRAILEQDLFALLFNEVILQAHNLSKDHKPDLEVEKDRILKAGGFIQVGRVNGSLNLARAIGNFFWAL
jgi:serine/threonine protein phosphatase PrpC